MPRFKEKKSNRGVFTPETMERAVNDVIQNKRSILAVAKEYGINRMTLSRYVKDAKNTNKNVICFKKSHSTKQVSDYNYSNY